MKRTTAVRKILESYKEKIGAEDYQKIENYFDEIDAGKNYKSILKDSLPQYINVLYEILKDFFNNGG